MAGSIRDRLTTAASQLKEAGHHDSAAAVEAVLAPGGWAVLKKATATGATSSLAISIDARLKAALQDAAEEFGVSFRQLVEEAYRKVLAGEWIPPKGGQRKNFTKSVLNVTVDAGLRSQVRELLPRLSEAEGRRISEASIVVTWACEELGVDAGTGAAMGLSLPVSLRDHFLAARDSGVSLEAVVDEGIRALLDGSWTLPRPSRMVGGQQFGTMRVRVDDRLRDALHDLAPVLSERLGVRVFPGTIVRQILTDRLGEPAE